MSLDLFSLSLPIAVMAFLVALGFSRLGHRVADQVWRHPRGGAAAAAGAEGAPNTGVVAKRTQRARAVLALSRFEGRRLLVHPIFLAILVFTLLQSIIWLPEAIRHERSDLLGVAFFSWSFFPGIGVLLAANLAALRSRRDRTEELYLSLPMTPARRTVAHLLSAGPAAVAIGLVLLGMAVWLSVAGHKIEIDEGRILTAGPDLADGAVYVGVLGALGVVLARWVPNPAAGSVAVVGLIVLMGAVSSPESSNLDPLAAWVIPVGGSGWHLLYLTGLAVLVGSIAVLKHGMSRPWGLGWGSVSCSRRRPGRRPPSWPCEATSRSGRVPPARTALAPKNDRDVWKRSREWAAGTVTPFGCGAGRSYSWSGRRGGQPEWRRSLPPRSPASSSSTWGAPWDGRGRPWRISRRRGSFCASAPPSCSTTGPRTCWRRLPPR